ncbi:MAG: amidohydrolase, partial [Acutalibacteraceae bacterium]
MSKQTVLNWIDQNKEELIKLSDAIWEYAEAGFHESQSAEAQIALLEKYGFTVEKGVAGMPTAFVASYGSGQPVIGLIGEYDALP